jgi:hypothetical protein
VDHACPVRSVDSASQFLDHSGGELWRSWRFGVLGEASTIHKFECDERAGVDLAWEGINGPDPEHLDDVGMLEAGDGLSLGPEAVTGFRFSERSGEKHLQSDNPLEFTMFRLENNTHSA